MWSRFYFWQVGVTDFLLVAMVTGISCFLAWRRTQGEQRSRSKKNGFDSYRKILLSTTGRTNWSSCSLQNSADCSLKEYLQTKDISAMHHFQSFPTLFDIRKIPSSLPNQGPRLFSFVGTSLLSSAFKTSGADLRWRPRTLLRSIFLCSLFRWSVYFEINSNAPRPVRPKWLFLIQKGFFSCFACFNLSGGHCVQCL